MKWPHCLSPDGAVAPARFDKWLPVNELLLKPAVCADMNLFAAAYGRPELTNRGFASVLLQRDRRQSLMLLTESITATMARILAQGLRSELICWPSGCKHNEMLTLLKWDLSTPRNSLWPITMLILVFGCFTTWSSIQGCDVLLFSVSRGSAGAASMLAFGGTVCQCQWQFP